MSSVYSDSGNMDHLLLVDGLWVVNGEWMLEKKDGQFINPLTKKVINLRLEGYISGYVDYNDGLYRFRNGEGEHIDHEKKSVPPVVAVAPEPEICKKRYYGIDCSCSRCNKGK